MAEGLVFDIEATDKATDELKDVQREIGKVEKSTGKLERKAKGLNDSLESQKAAFKNVGMVAGAAAAAITMAAGAAISAAKAYGEQEAVTKRLEFSLRALGKTDSEVRKALADSNAIFAANQAKTAFGDEAQAEALTGLIGRTGDYTKAQAALVLSMDAAAAKGRDLADVSKSIGEAMTGDLGPLKELGLLTAEQITRFNKITDATERWNKALEEIKPQIDGAAEAQEGMQTATKRLTNDLGDLEQAAGKVIVGFTGIVAGAAGLDKNSSVVKGAADGTDSLGQKLMDVSENATQSEKAMLAFSAAGALTGTLMTMGAGAIPATGLLNEKLDDLHEKVMKGTDGINHFKEGMQRAAKEAAELQKTIDSFEFFGPTPEQLDLVEKDRKQRAKKAAEARMRDRQKAEEKFLAWRAEREKEIAEEIADHNLALTIEMNDLAIQGEMAMNEARIRSSEELADALLAIEVGSFEDRRAYLDEFRAEEDEILAAGAQRRAEYFSAAAEGAGVAAAAAEGLGDAYKAIAGGVADAGAAVAGLAAKQWDFNEGAESAVGALNAASGVASGIAEAAGMGIQERAGFMAAFETAAAIAAGAAALMFPNPAYVSAAVQHGIAAGQFALVATGAIGGGGGGKSVGAKGGGGGGTRGAPTAGGGFDPREAAAINAQAIGEVLGADKGGASTININMVNPMLMGNSAEVSEFVYRKFEDGAKNHGLDVRDLSRKRFRR